MTWRTGRAVAVALAMALAAIEARAAASSGAGNTATLTVLAPPVDRVAAGAAGMEPGVNGMSLGEGDRIKTGAAGQALITFLDGSTVTVQPNADVTVKQTVERGATGVRLLIHAGRVWARVVRSAGRRAPLSLESNEYAATAHDGLIGAERTGGEFVCWTRRGEVRLTDRSGQTDVVLMAGRRARAHFGSPVVPEPFVPSASVIEIKTTGPVVPLVRMPDGRTAAGFLADRVEVNQVFGSLTEGEGTRWLVEVPGGQAGAYSLILTGTAEGPFNVRITGRYASLPVYRQDLSGHARPGERLATRIIHEVSGSDPRTARAIDASFEGLRRWDGGDPAVLVSSPLAAERSRLVD